MRASENVFPALDDVAEARVVDDHRIEAADIESALARSCHREKIGLFFFTFEAWTNDANRLSPVIIRSVDAGKPRLHELRGLFDARACRQKHSNAAALLDDLLEKSILEKVKRVFPHNPHLSGTRWMQRKA